MSNVQFRSADRSLQLPGRSALKAFIAGIFKKEKQALASITYVFCSDAFLLQMNRDFLQHDYYTDIITFDLGTEKKSISGELYISLDRVKDNAVTLGQKFSSEFIRVVAHGLLHLIGFQDKKSEQIVEMRACENESIELYLSLNAITESKNKLKRTK